MSKLRVIIAAGGTGGHLWPALSLALALRRARPETEFLFIGAGRPMEEKILGPYGFERRILTTSGLKGQGLGGQIRALGQSLAAVTRARDIIKDFKPGLCFGAGGYVTVPVGLAAKIAGVPLVIHEQNSRPGLSNRVLGRLAKLVLVAFDETVSFFPAGKVLIVGNPVRPEIAALHDRPRDFSKTPLTVAITGGSQGARELNRRVAPALMGLHKKGLDMKVIHQSGASDLEWVRGVYAEGGPVSRTEEFITDMPAFYAAADLVIGRAGAVTISELAAAKVPSVLVPLPSAADDHQAVNARRLEKSGAAEVVAEADLPLKLESLLGDLITDPGRLAAMSEAAGRAAQLEADKLMAEACLEIMNENSAVTPKG